MKVQLEFEKTDLEEMLTLYFERSGFSIKNLDELCEQFASAFPDGIKVQAEILSNYEPPAREDPSPTYLDAGEFDGDSSEEVEDTEKSANADPVSEVVEIVEETRLGHGDLMDPTRPIPGNETKDMAEIMGLVRQSKALERMR